MAFAVALDSHTCPALKSSRPNTPMRRRRTTTGVQCHGFHVIFRLHWQFSPRIGHSPRERVFALSVSLRALAPATQNAFLSAELRARTATLHGRIENLLGLPGAIRSAEGYAAWLARFLGFYEPLERELASFPEWTTQARALQPQSQSARICSDLAAMGVDARAAPRASPGLLPELPTFSHAVGAFYVVEGAKLGGRVILRDLDARLGAGIAGARSFFGGRGSALLPDWNEVRAALDCFGSGRPQVREDVVRGAERTFEAMLAWFRHFRAERPVPS